METETGGERVWAIGDLNRRARLAVVKEFRGPVWVAGELTKLDERRGSRWLELVERGGGRDGRDAHLRAFCSATRWARLDEKLARADVGVRVGQRLVVVGGLEIGDRGELTLTIDDVDVAGLVGERVMARRRLLQRLADDDLLDANRRLVLSPLPLRVGLVTSRGSDGHRDLLRQLDSSGFAFRVTLQAVSVEGPHAARAIHAALVTFAPADVDVAVIVRGGGTKASLDVFDTDAVADAIATSAVPVWTGIGHSADRTVADEVAHRCCATPTAVGQALAAVVADAWGSVAAAGARIAGIVDAELSRADYRVDGRRRHLSSLVRSQLTMRQQAQARTSVELQRAVSRGLDSGASRLMTASDAVRASAGVLDGQSVVLAVAVDRVRRTVDRQLDAGRDRVASGRAVLDAYDPRRQLARGWTLTHTVDGRLVRRAAELRAGDPLVTTFADGAATSIVTGVTREDKEGTGE